jgi:hypothetical protein
MWGIQVNMNFAVGENRISITDALEGTYDEPATRQN